MRLLGVGSVLSSCVLTGVISCAFSRVLSGGFSCLLSCVLFFSHVLQAGDLSHLLVRSSSAYVLNSSTVLASRPEVDPRANYLSEVKLEREFKSHGYSRTGSLVSPNVVKPSANALGDSSDGASDGPLNVAPIEASSPSNPLLDRRPASN